MRLPFPERISLFYVFCFAALISTAQVLEGTSAVFAVCCFFFIIVAGITFNLAGGFTRPSGSYVFFYAVLGVIIGLTWKVIIGEPAESNLVTPLLTAEVYLAGISAMLGAVYVSRKITLKRAILGSLVTDANMQNATIGCMVTGLVISALLATVPHQSGTLLSALAQLNNFLPVAILLGVTHQIRRSRGASSVNLPVLISGAGIFIAGLLGFSKEGILTAFFCWAITACSLRFRLSLIQIAGCILGAIFIFQYLVPYAQYGRVYRSDSFSTNLSAAVSLLTELGTVRKEYAVQQEYSPDKTPLAYFDTPQGFFDRLQMIGPDDALINATERDGAFGMGPIYEDIENTVPHFIWPNKPTLHFAAEYAREIGGILPEEDTTTGISFSPTGEAFHVARWTGVLVVAPVIWMVLFTVFDSLCGDVRKSPWGVLVIVLFAHAAPEGGLAGPIYLVTYAMVGIVFAAVVAAYVMPLIGTAIAGPEKIRVIRTGGLRVPIPRRLTSPLRIQAPHTDPD